MNDDPSNAELLAPAISLALAGRNLIERTDRTSLKDTCEMLDVLHESLAIAGGSLLILAERLGINDDAMKLVERAHQRLANARASSGLGGGA